MSTKHIRKEHNVSLLMYHLVCPVKYRKGVFTEEVEKTLKNICIEIEKRYEVHFIEIGTDNDHVHFLLQSIPTYSPSSLTQKIKSITAIQIFKKHPNIKKEVLWGGQFWTKGFYINTVGKFANEEIMKNYVKNQGLSKKHQASYRKVYFNPKQDPLF